MSRELLRIIGVCIVAAPSVLLFAWVVKIEGWKRAIVLFVCICAFVIAMFIGTGLLMGDNPLTTAAELYRDVLK